MHKKKWIGPDDPRFYPCDSCGAERGKWCVSKNGRIIREIRSQHGPREAKARYWIHGR